MSASEPVWRGGGCHCGLVRFEARLADEVEAQTCTCSMCEKVGFVHVIVPESRFRLLRGADQITTYTFNTGVAQHTFCSVCGVKSFYVPRSHPDGYSVNFRCLDAEDFTSVLTTDFDGKNWETHGASLAHLSRE